LLVFKYLRRKVMKTISLFLVVVVLASLLSGCIQPISTEEAQQEVEQAESALCASIEAYTGAVEALEGVTAETTIAEYEALQQAEATSYDAMVAAWGDLQEAEVQAVESAVAELKNSLDGVTGETTLGAIATEIQTNAADVKAAVDQLDQTACVPTLP
jgi:hypothetical protein